MCSSLLVRATCAKSCNELRTYQYIFADGWLFVLASPTTQLAILTRAHSFLIVLLCKSGNVGGFYRKAKRNIRLQILVFWTIATVNTVAIIMLDFVQAGRRTPILPMSIHVSTVYVLRSASQVVIVRESFRNAFHGCRFFCRKASSYRTCPRVRIYRASREGHGCVM